MTEFAIVNEMSGQAYDADKQLIARDGEGEEKGLGRCRLETVRVSWVRQRHLSQWQKC